jgi:hypothetical protein
VLLYVARHADAQLRVVALEVGITERATHRILNDLADAGYITISRHGRRNHYRINSDINLRHESTLDVPLGPLLNQINDIARDLTPWTETEPTSTATRKQTPRARR